MLLGKHLKLQTTCVKMQNESVTQALLPAGKGYKHIGPAYCKAYTIKLKTHAMLLAS